MAPNAVMQADQHSTTTKAAPVPANKFKSTPRDLKERQKLKNKMREFSYVLAKSPITYCVIVMAVLLAPLQPITVSGWMFLLLVLML